MSHSFLAFLLFFLLARHQQMLYRYIEVGEIFPCCPAFASYMEKVKLQVTCTVGFLKEKIFRFDSPAQFAFNTRGWRNRRKTQKRKWEFLGGILFILTMPLEIPLYKGHQLSFLDKLRDKAMAILLLLFVLPRAFACNFLVESSSQIGSTVLHSNSRDKDCILSFPASSTELLSLNIDFERLGNKSER